MIFPQKMDETIIFALFFAFYPTVRRAKNVRKSQGVLKTEFQLYLK